MEILKLGQTLVTQGPQVLLDPGLRPGTYVVQLIVTGTQGESAPAQVRIVLFDPTVVTPA